MFGIDAKYKLIMMRGLGYNQIEIADSLGVSQATIQYQLSNINKMARGQGDSVVFYNMVLSIYILNILKDVFELTHNTDIKKNLR